MSLSTAIAEMRAILTEQVPTHQEFCAQVIVADGRQRGQPLSVDGHPAQEALVRAFDSNRYRRFAWAKPVQDGGTLLMLVALLRRAIVERQTVVLAYPTTDAAKDIWTTKIFPVLAAYGGQEPETGGGSRGGVAKVVRLPGGGMFILRAAGGRGESGQASITGDALGVDEVDDWPDLHRVELIGQRINESIDPLAVYCCTVKRDGAAGTPDASLILALVDEGTNGTLHYPCPACGLYQPIVWERVDQDTACYVCTAPACEHHWSEDERRLAFHKWRLVEQNPDAGMFSLRWSALDSPRRSMLDLVTQFKRAEIFVANSDHGAMRSFWRDRLTRTYTGDQTLDDDGKLAFPNRSRIAAMSAASEYGMIVDRREKDGDSIHLCEAPAWADHLTVGVDVQDGGVRAPGRLYFVIHARGSGRSAIIGWGTIHASPIGRHPTPAELHEALLRLEQLLKDWTPAVPIVAVGVDTGDGERTEDINNFLLNRRLWKAVKGTGPLKPILDDQGRPLHSELPGWCYWRKGLFLIETRSVTYICQRAMLAPSGKAGSMSVPRGIGRQDAMAKHLCGTVMYAPDKWSERERDRIHHPDWHPRHDYLDCLAYAVALSHAWEADRDLKRKLVTTAIQQRTASTSIRSALAVSSPPPPRNTTIQRRHGIHRPR